MDTDMLHAYKPNWTNQYCDECGKPMDSVLHGAMVVEIPRLEGKKSDADKPRMELLSSVAMMETAKVLNLGAKKYSDNNWRKGFDWSRLIGACYRHLAAFNDGEDLDQETGLSHVAHLSCEVMFLLEHVLKGMGRDDRWKGTK